MQFFVDPAGTLELVAKAELALDDLTANFDACDLATFYVAAALESGAPAVGDSVRDVAAREGGHRTKPFAQAHQATQTLRGTIADWVRHEEGVVRELEQIGQSALSEAEKVAVGAAHVAKNIVEGSVNAAENIVEGTVNAAENLVEGTVNAAENVVGGAVHGAEEAAEGLVSGVTNLGKLFHR